MTFTIIYCRYSVENISESTNCTFEPIVNLTPMSSSYAYVMYYRNIATLIVLGILPLILLSYWNLNIYKGITHSLNLTGKTQNIQNRDNQEKEMARVLIGIVVMFILCHTLRIYLDIYDATTLKHGTLEVWLCMSLGEEGLPPQWKLILTEIKELMLVINSSVNMVIYCCLNSTFRKNFFSWCKKKNRKPSKCTVEKETSVKKKDEQIIWNPNFDRQKSSIYIYN